MALIITKNTPADRRSASTSFAGRALPFATAPGRLPSRWVGITIYKFEQLGVREGGRV